MTDAPDDQREDIEPAEPVTENTAPADVAPDGGRSTAPAEPDLEELLAEYDAARSQPTEQQQPFDVDALMERDNAAARTEQMTGLEQREAAIERALLQQQEAERVKFETESFIKFAAEGQAELADKHLPPNYLENYLLAAAAKDSRVLWLWNHRNNPQLSPQTRAQIAGQLRAVRDRGVAEARHLPDPIATADRDAVVAAMRGASGPVGPEPAPAFGHMTDKELNAYSRRQFGFEAI